MHDGFWIGLQADYDMTVTRAALAEQLERITPFEDRARAA